MTLRIQVPPLLAFWSVMQLCLSKLELLSAPRLVFASAILLELELELGLVLVRCQASVVWIEKLEGEQVMSVEASADYWVHTWGTIEN
jgi:hypothetical protein